jgi:hypothetical protein
MTKAEVTRLRKTLDAIVRSINADNTPERFEAAREALKAWTKP